jgi:hypothetical protein
MPPPQTTGRDLQPPEPAAGTAALMVSDASERPPQQTANRTRKMRQFAKELVNQFRPLEPMNSQWGLPPLLSDRPKASNTEDGPDQESRFRRPGQANGAFIAARQPQPAQAADEFDFLLRLISVGGKHTSSAHDLSSGLLSEAATIFLFSRRPYVS